MKPLSKKTYIDQALAWASGENVSPGCTWIDDCRIPTDEPIKTIEQSTNSPFASDHANIGDGTLGSYRRERAVWTNNSIGRYPANLMVSDDVLDLDEDGPSRYFSLDAWAERLPFLMVAKPTKKEKNAGCEELGNTHSTVKPLKLMAYLITLGSREGDVVLDPFVGSGTTCVAAKMLGRNYIGIELNPEYADIANARINATMEEACTAE